MNTTKTRSLSELITDLQAHIDGDKTSIATILNAFHERGFGFFLFLIALPAALPIPAIGINTIIALPLMMLTAQQAIGRKTLWLPEKWKSKEVSSAKIEGFIESSKPWLKRIEFFIRPRLSFITQGVFSYVIGITGFIMSLAVAIPLPLTNTVPAFGIALMAVGILMRDGLAVIGGILIGLAWVVLLITAFYLFGSEAVDIIKNFIKGML